MQWMDLSTPIASIVGDARGRLLEEVVRVDQARSIREWATRAGVNDSHAASLLREFEGMGLVRSTKVGRSLVVEAVPDSILRRHLQGLLRIPDEIVDVARTEAKAMPSDVRVFVFGSASRGTLSAGSDIDVCVVAHESSEIEEYVDRFVRKLSVTFPMPVNLLRFTPQEWSDASRNGERIVREVMSGIEVSGEADGVG